MTRKLLFVFVLAVFVPGLCRAQSPCLPSATSNVTDSYEIEVVPFHNTYHVEQPLVLPRAQPVTRDVPVLRLYVVIEEKDPAKAATQLEEVITAKLSKLTVGTAQ